MSRLFKLKRDDKGQGIVEFALIVPILLMLILGMIEFGWVLNGKITLNSAVREGARAGAVYDKEDLSQKVLTVVEDTTKNSGLKIDVSNSKAYIEKDDYNLPKNVVVEVKAHLNPIVGLFFKGDVIIESRAIMKKE